MDTSPRLDVIKDFLEDKRFQDWMRSDRQQEDDYWKEWLSNNVAQKSTFYEAVATWKILHQVSAGWNEDMVVEKKARLLHRLRQEPVVAKPLYLRFSYLVAAAVVVLISALAVQWMMTNEKLGLPATAITSLTTKTDWIERENTTSQPLLLNLPDGSSVVLAPHSVVKYAAQMDKNERSAYLQGEAFFEVAKNSALPFVVYTSRLTTKVLGTTFRVRAFSEDEIASVKVITGRVEVQPVVAHQLTGVAKPILLDSNEEVLIHPRQGLSEEVLTEVQTNRHLANEEQMFRFRFTPLSEVYTLLENTYHVQILYDVEKFGRCTITANLSDMPFHKKLELICESIGATYELTDTVVKISGNGCR